MGSLSADFDRLDDYAFSRIVPSLAPEKAVDAAMQMKELEIAIDANHHAQAVRDVSKFLLVWIVASLGGFVAMLVHRWGAIERPSELPR